MHVSWPGSRCIICLNEEPLAIEHIIPKSLGGILTSSLLCCRCNSTFGESFEATAKSDPSIRIAVENLKHKIPRLAGKLRENQAYVATSLGSNEPGVIIKGDFRIKSRTVNNGSIIQPTADARLSVEKMHSRSGKTEVPLSEVLRKFDSAPMNERIRISPELMIVKRNIEKIEPDFSGDKLMSPLVPLKIAFELLSFHLGTLIYDETQQLSDLRRTLFDGIENDPCFNVERLNASEFEPFHGIFFQGNNPHACFLIRLFGGLAFQVHLLRLAVIRPKFVYTHCMETNLDYFRTVDHLSNTS